MAAPTESAAAVTPARLMRRLEDNGYQARAPEVRLASCHRVLAGALAALALICAGCASPAPAGNSRNGESGTLKVTVIEDGGPEPPGGGTQQHHLANALVIVSSIGTNLSSQTDNAGVATFRLPSGSYHQGRRRRRGHDHPPRTGGRGHRPARHHVEPFAGRGSAGRSCLGARYNLRTADATHLATAVSLGARRFITNNSRDFGRHIKEIDVTFPADLPETES